MILLDTDICLSILKGKISGTDLAFISENEIAVTAITAEELFYAANRSSDPIGNRILAEKFLLTVKILHTDLAAMKYIADVQLSLKRHGKQFPYADIVIYSLAKNSRSAFDNRKQQKILFHVKHIFNNPYGEYGLL